ncbi:reprolysin-like metallopeptidase [Flavobacterium akiainvivens]|uniref:reprolysin-like metallopeptidase n=1 Tax=Flavobacterium akiainvivens TaxID=1202724 RepID=UPI0006C83A9B|nr:zinc-dependent metalloprotease family protein [Flavobacterium akiainvivens]SFQ46347.1 Por secretion system C-terminal sorting domain-containing protein [Flavobacterium akiainvivens]
MKLRLLFYAALLATGYSHAQAWQKEQPGALAGTQLLERGSTPQAFTAFSLDLEALKQQIANAPLRSAHTVSTVTASFPDANGNLQNYRIYYAPVMQPGLAALHPGIRSYSGVNVNNPAETIRFSITQYGLHNMTFAPGQASYTDPYTTDYKYYIVYKKQDVTTARTFHCDTQENAHNNHKSAAKTLDIQSTDGTMRVYRLAMACTVEYAAFHINEAGLNEGTLAEKKEAVLAAMNVTMTRVNGVYERDFAITMQLIDTNEDIIFIDLDEFDNSNTDNALLGASQEVIDAHVGFDSYDIGHVVSTGGGGVAQLWSPCSGSKARGITGLGSPVGDPFDIDYVAHEMGHQFGGNHSFNNECGGNRNNATAYEPGSGTTIMAYAGVCDPNVEWHSDAQFHAQSIAEMSWFIANGGNCGANTLTGNIPPVAEAGKNYTIPKSTAFILEGSATDANNDNLTYCWEQFDNEISVQPPQAGSNVGPNFRSLPIKESPQRFMPDIEDVLANNLYPTWEVISDVARSFTFAFTVRDNNILGGQTVTDYMEVHVSGTAGPFLVTSPNTNVSWQAGTNQNVTWDVAGTTANGVYTPYVDIFLSVDGGYTYPTILAAKVPNDGSEVVTIPNVTGGNKRIMVKGYKNLFYDLGDTNFSITAPATTMAIAVTGDQNISACKGNDVVYSLQYNAYAGFSGTTTYAITGNPMGSTVTFTPNSTSANGIVNVTVSNTDGAAVGFYSMTVTATSGSETKIVHIYLDLFDTGFGPVVPVSPADGATAVDNNVTLEWQTVANASAYVVQIATDESFTEIISETNLDSESYTALLEESTEYFWRLAPANEGCAGDYSETFSFVTGYSLCQDVTSADVPVVISDSEAVTVTSSLLIEDNTPIQSLTVSMYITHTWVGDLTATLISPMGTEVQLFSQDCGDRHDVNATFSDAGETSACDDAPNATLNGLILPDEALSAFAGESPEGEWTLQVFDEFGADGGTLNSWSLNICTLQEFLNVQENAFAGFALYPNPNMGVFTVRFNASGNDNVQVNVFDMRGRKIAGKNYGNTGGVFEQQIAFEAQQGVYLVQVQEGARSITKKIVIQ